MGVCNDDVVVPGIHEFPPIVIGEETVILTELHISQFYYYKELKREPQAFNNNKRLPVRVGLMHKLYHTPKFFFGVP